MKAEIQERLLRKVAEVGEEEAQRRRAEHLVRDPILSRFLRTKLADVPGSAGAYSGLLISASCVIKDGGVRRRPVPHGSWRPLLGFPPPACSARKLCLKSLKGSTTGGSWACFKRKTDRHRVVLAMSRGAIDSLRGNSGAAWIQRRNQYP
jgi:hypothetical protein